MKTTATFTSTISPKAIAWVDKTARSEKRTRRSVLEEAIKRYQRDNMQRVLKEGFARAARDPDMVELAEWGVADYQDVLSLI